MPLMNQQDSLSRRYFLASAAATALGFAALHRHVSAADTLLNTALVVPGYGPLQPDPEGILDLPEGFSYRIISRMGDEMSDGLLVPGKPDGMATFPVANDENGRFCLVIRNHELNPDNTSEGPFGKDSARFKALDPEMQQRLYDAGYGLMPSLGGTTTLLLDLEDPASPRIVREYLSLGGTVRNCAGGPTPWGTWITCEETLVRVGTNTEHSHGYNFEVPADPEQGLVKAVPLKEMGRFNHEAVCVDPRSGAVYQTEDAGDGLIYRFLPNSPGELHKGGRLQALVVKGRPSLDSRNWDQQTVSVGETFDVEWIDMDDVDNLDNSMKIRGFEAGACRFARGEGMWFGDTGQDGAAVYFACTNGGPARKGQIWRYIPSRFEGQAEEAENPGKLTLFVEPNDGELVDNADNLTVNPHGGLVVCEDNGRLQHLRGVTSDGKLYTLARNAKGNSEFAGACFDPTGKVLFVNIQHTGLTLAITGPWGDHI